MESILYLYGMKNLFYPLVISILFLFSCSEDCQTCETVIYNDEFKQLGLANNGFDERSRVLIGELCGDEIDEAKKAEREYTVNGSVTYTERIRIECK